MDEKNINSIWAIYSHQIFIKSIAIVKVNPPLLALPNPPAELIKKT